MSRKVVLGVLAGFLLVHACAGTVVWGITHDLRQQFTQAFEAPERPAQAKAVDEAFVRIWDRLETRDAVWDQAEHCGLDMATLVEFTVDDIEEVRGQVARARRLAEDIPDADVREAYLAVCDELDAEFEDPTAGVADVQPLSDAAAIIDYALRVHEPVARSYLDNAIRANSETRYADAYPAAVTADDEYSQVHLAYRQAAEASGVEGVLTACDYIETQMARAEVEQELAMLEGAARAGAFVEYNKRTEELRVLGEEQEGLLDEAYDALWAEAEATFPPIGGRAQKAKQLWEDAQVLTGRSTW